jgi:hypothetical protein
VTLATHLAFSTPQDSVLLLIDYQMANSPRQKMS